MECAIYALGELKKKRRGAVRQVLVLARRGEGLILLRDELNALWRLPGAEPEGGESAEETARRALGNAVGDAVFGVWPLCEFDVVDEGGARRGGIAFIADVEDWPDERESHARVFTRMPLSSQAAQPALMFALHRWAGEHFDERLSIARLGEPALF